MKTIILTLSILLSATICFGQEESSLTFYYPNGEKYVGKANTMKKICNETEKYGRIYNYMVPDKFAGVSDIGFLLFTNEVKWVLAYDTTNYDNIKKAARSFNLNEYFNSFKFEMDLEKYIERKNLSDIFILQTLGKPNDAVKRHNTNYSIELWTYNRLGLTLKFRDGIVIEYTRAK